MIIGIVKERFPNEWRVALTPAAVESLVKSGNTIFVEKGAGDGVRFTDDQYRNAGANVVYTEEEVIRRAKLVLKVLPPSPEEYTMLQDDQIFMSFLLLGIAKRTFIEYLINNNITTIGYELLEHPTGIIPIQRSMSEIAGPLAIHMAAIYLGSHHNGRGILLGGLPGVAPSEVVILGAGALGQSAARAANGLGAHVILLDSNISKLREAEQHLGKNISTVVASPDNIRRGVAIADAFIGAISITDDESHHLITEEMVKSMKPGSVIIDLSIDQGGCVETSRPTSIKDPIFTKHNVIHYCVPNLPSIVARTSTYALTNNILPFIKMISERGLAHAVQTDDGMHTGIATYHWKATHYKLTEMFDIPCTDIRTLV